MRIFSILVIMGLLVLTGCGGISAVPSGNFPLANAAEFNSFGIETVSVSRGEITNNRYLELVNHHHKITADPNSRLLAPVRPVVPISAGSQEPTLHTTALSAVGELFSAARSANVGTFTVSSGFRNIEEQERIYNSGMDKSLVKPPGHSEHHTGLGVDILAVGVQQSEMGNSAEGRWLAENSWRFGLVLRYPTNRQNITGIAFEPWHFRYVGQPHASYMRQNNLVLEEYIEFLRSAGGYTAEINGREYTVFYQVPDNGMLEIPSGGNFTISSDNTGGYIVTAWS